MACHRRIEQRLATLVKAAGHLEGDREGAMEAIAKSIHFLDTNGVMHTEDEEESLFPRLRPKLSAEELEFVAALEAQHEEAEAVFGELKAAVAALDGSEAAAAGYEECARRLQALYLAHIHDEDTKLTPLARRSLTDAETAEMTGEMRGRRGLVRTDSGCVPAHADGSGE